MINLKSFDKTIKFICKCDKANARFISDIFYKMPEEMKKDINKYPNRDYFFGNYSMTYHIDSNGAFDIRLFTKAHEYGIILYPTNIDNINKLNPLSADSSEPIAYFYFSGENECEDGSTDFDYSINAEYSLRASVPIRHNNMTRNHYLHIDKSGDEYSTSDFDADDLVESLLHSNEIGENK